MNLKFDIIDFCPSTTSTGRDDRRHGPGHLHQRLGDEVPRVPHSRQICIQALITNPALGDR